MDKKIMATLDKWFHFNIRQHWTHHNEKKFNRKFNTDDERDRFLMAFAYEKMNLLENEMDDLKQDIMIEMESEFDELKQEIREEVRRELTLLRDHDLKTLQLLKQDMNQEIKTIISLCGILGKDLHALKMKNYSKNNHQEITTDLIDLL